jgi:hypothetical protein
MKKYIILLIIALLSPIVNYAQELSASVYFEPAKFELKTEEETSLKIFLENLPANKSAYDILLVGHTDNVGEDDYNKRLSHQRCKIVKNYLLTQGIAVPQLAYEGKGYNAPAATNKTLEGKAKNRRVELVLMPRGSFSDARVKVTKEVIIFDAKDGVTYTYERSGTEVRIPAEVLVYANGKPVEGAVEVSYREFRDAADFIATDIPMMFDHHHQFESAGMFELTAFQGDEKVFVKEGAYVDVEFMMTSDTVEDVSFFEYQNNQWSALGVLDRTTQENTFEVNGPCKKIYRYRMPPIKDTLTTFLNAMRTGYYLAKEKGFEQYYRIGFLTMDERFNDRRYAGTNYLHYKERKIDWEMVKEQITSSPVRFNYNEEYKQTDVLMREIKLKKGLWMEFKNGQGKGNALTKFPELQELAKRKWLVLPKGKHKPSARANVLRVLDRHYVDIRINYLGANNFQFVLKGIEVYDTLVAQPVFQAIERKTKETVSQLLIANYNRNIKNRRTRFDERIQFYEENWKYFLAFSKSIMPRDEQCKGISGWVQYFGKNRKIMEKRYYAYSGLGENIEVLRPLMTKAVNGTPIRLDNPPRSPNDRLAQRLSLSGFGVFNCDAIQLLGKERVMVTANFIDTEGSPIDAKVINVIDYSLNSILRLYDANKVSFNPTKKTAIVIIDFFGDIYVVDPEGIKANDYGDGKKAYDLKGTKIITNTVDAIRGAIVAN